MSGYLKSAINEIYRKDKDFIVIGLTGRTGSGCSTVAKILASENQKIKHNLFSGETPETNDQRKQKIIKNYFDKTWEPFYIVQARSIITLLIVNHGVDDAISKIKETMSISAVVSEEIHNLFKKIRDEYKNISDEEKRNDATNFIQNFYRKFVTI